MVVIVLITGPLSAVTIVGNLLVILSFRVNSHLRTVSNYFLLSLAVADLILGAVSMNFYTTYILIGQWTLGNLACDVWLAVDYVASNASVMNLLAICCDRYLSVTRPLTYRAKRTPRRAAIMIGLAWGVSFAIWAPPILFWEDMVGERKVPEGECSVQFFYVPVITFVTAIAAFYLPVTIMAFLFWKIFQETENRSKDLAGLKGSGNQSKASKPSKPNETTKTNSSADGPENNSFDENGGNNIVNLSQSDGENTTEQQPSKIHAAMAKRFAHKAKMSLSKRKSQSVVKEKKAAQTLSAILLAFMMTWTPYNIMVLVNTFCTGCIPETLWALGYWLCYVNSTINPMCYALCNKNFRDTFKMILLCQWKAQKAKPQFHPKQRQVPPGRKKEPP